MYPAVLPVLLRASRRRHWQGRRVVLPLRGARKGLRFVMINSHRFGLLQRCAFASRNVPRKASSCNPRLGRAIQGCVL